MLKIHIKYFGIAQDYTQTPSECITTNGTLKQIINSLYQKYPQLNNPKIKIAHNFQILNQNDNWDIPVKNNDEIAFLPPFAGG